MGDTRLRELERTWRATGASADEAAWLAERVRVGALAEARRRSATIPRMRRPWPVLVLLVACAGPEEPRREEPRRAERRVDPIARAVAAGRLPRERVALAAYLGDARAVASGVPAWKPPEDPRDPLGRALTYGGLDRPTLVRLSAEMAAHLLPRFEAAHPGDDRPRRAIEAALRWASGGGDVEACRRWRVECTNVGEAYGLGPEDVRVASELPSFPCSAVVDSEPGATVAEGAWYAARNVPGEGAWHVRRVCDLLLTPTPWPAAELPPRLDGTR